MEEPAAQFPPNHLLAPKRMVIYVYAPIAPKNSDKEVEMKHWFCLGLIAVSLACTAPQAVEQSSYSIDLEKVSSETLRTHNALLLQDPRYTDSILRGANKVGTSKVYNAQTLQTLVDSFEKRGGTVVFVPFDEQMKIKLPKQADFYPVCKGGVNRSQVTYIVLQELTKGNEQSRIELPHGVAIGYESPDNRPMAYENPRVVTTKTYEPIDFLGGNSYFETAMKSPRPKRFGYDRTDFCKGTISSAPLNCDTPKQRKYFADHYWTGQGDKHRVFITFGSAGVITMERANPTDTTVIIFALEDYVSQLGNHSPNASQEDFVGAFQQLRSKISSVLVMQQ
ncbi:MAG: hypothetical protein HYW48_02185 [Deltaproteobacteria bacterium]|nr:hypothetical protein [Deltaproteobacteria bacterium]